MKIAVNTRFLLKNRLEGIGWFTYETCKRITRWHPEHEFIFIFDRPFDPEFVFSENVSPVVVFPPARHPFLWYWWFEQSLPRFFRKNNIDLFFSPDGFLSLSSSVPSLAVIHDLNFEHRPGDLPFLTGNFYRHFFPEYARKAVRIGTVSGFSKEDISQCYGIDPGKIDVYYNGANSAYIPLSSEEKARTREKYSGGKEYFVFVGSLHPRKNIKNLLLAFDAFRKTSSRDMRLVIVGDKMFGNREMETVYAGMKFRDEVLFTGHLLPEELRFVVGAATALVLVSFFEGFGIPLLEAMQCDVPLIASAVTSLPEVAGKAAIYADPSSPDSIKEAMLKMSDDKDLRNHLVEKGRLQRKKFSWDSTAERLWMSIEKCLEKNGK